MKNIINKPFIIVAFLLVCVASLYAQSGAVLYVNHPTITENNFATVHEAVTSEIAQNTSGLKTIKIFPDFIDGIPQPTKFSDSVTINCSGVTGHIDKWTITGEVPEGYDPKDYIIFDNGDLAEFYIGVPVFYVTVGGTSPGNRNVVTICNMTIQRTLTGSEFPAQYSDAPGISVDDRDVYIQNVRFGSRSNNSNYAYAVQCIERPGKSAHKFYFQDCIFEEACDIGKSAIDSKVIRGPNGEDSVYNLFVFDSYFKNNGNSIVAKDLEIFWITNNQFLNTIPELASTSVAVETEGHSSSLNNNEFKGNTIKNHKEGLKTSSILITEIMNNYFYDNTISVNCSGGGSDVCNNLILVNNVNNPQSNAIGIQNNSYLLLSKNTIINTSQNQGDHYAVDNQRTMPPDFNHSNIFWNFESCINPVSQFKYSCYNGNHMIEEPTNLYDSEETTTDDFNNPWYMETIPENYMLTQNSICIDKGSIDPNHNSIDYTLDPDDREPDGTRYDIGYKFFDQNYFDQHYFLHGGWNWVCFPKLELIDIENSVCEPPYNVFSPLFNNYFKEAKTERNRDPLLFTWNGEVYVDHIEEMKRYDTYKILIEANNDYQFEYVKRYGERIANDYAVDLVSGQDNWIGYYPANSSTIEKAFGTYLSEIQSIKAENWTWVNMTNEQKGWDEPIPVPSMKNRKLLPRQGLIIRVKQNINNFVWQDIPVNETPTQPVVRAEFFMYNDKEKYEVIDVMSVENPVGLKEIGVFEGDTCIGAVKAEELPVQLLAYTSAVNGAKDNTALSFQLHYDSKSNNNSASYQLWDAHTTKYQAELLYGGKNFYSRVKLGKGDNFVNPAQYATLNACYPNPFNPSTTISWDMPTPGQVEISVYNLKGQKVQTLTNQQYSKGKYQIVWNGKNSLQQSVSSGIYFIRLKQNEKNQTRKVILVK